MSPPAIEEANKELLQMVQELQSYFATVLTVSAFPTEFAGGSTKPGVEFQCSHDTTLADSECVPHLVFNCIRFFQSVVAAVVAYAKKGEHNGKADKNAIEQRIIARWTDIFQKLSSKDPLPSEWAKRPACMENCDLRIRVRCEFIATGG